MIKAEELMIGNYIIQIINNSTERIIGVSWQEIKWIIDSNNIYKPIPITEEILEKLGFENSVNYVIKGMIIFKCDNDFICSKTGISIKSVHQLQNLYFALTQKHLTFK